MELFYNRNIVSAGLREILLIAPAQVLAKNVFCLVQDNFLSTNTAV